MGRGDILLSQTSGTSGSSELHCLTTQRIKGMGLYQYLYRTETKADCSTDLTEKLSDDWLNNHKCQMKLSVAKVF